MMGMGADKGVSLLVEYLILMGILSVFVVVMSLQIHDTLSEVQLSRVVENNFADVASQISAIYTDYVLILPDNGSISTKIEMPSTIGKLGYSAKLNKTGDVAYILVEGGKYSAASGLGLAKFISKSGVISVGTGGEIISFQVEAEKKEEKPKVEYEKSIECPFIPKPRIEFIQSSVAIEDNFGLKVSFVNKDEITKSIRWNVTLWNGSVISGSDIDKIVALKLIDENEVKNQCVKRNDTSNDYECYAWIRAEIVDLPHCNASDANKLLVSLKPEESNPYLVCKKWIEPRIVSPGDVFDVNLRIEGRGFLLNSTNLSVVHVIDVSGSMILPTIFKNYSFTVNPNVIKETVTLNSSGKLEIWAYTSDRLTSWYSNSACKACSNATGNCPWYNVGYDESFVKLYVNGVDSGGDYNSGGKIGKYYSQNNAPAGNYTIEVVARAPEQINLTIVVKHQNTEILNKTYQYVNKQEVEFELPPLPSGGSYGFLAVVGVQNLPEWSERIWSNWKFIPSEGNYYWRYNFSTCGYNSFNDNKLNVWFVKADNTKEFLVKGNNKTVIRWCILGSWSGCTRYAYWNSTAWYVAQDNRDISREYFNMSADAFIPYPNPGTYKFVVVPTTKDSVTFNATVFVMRIDAAKLAGTTFNGMLGQKDFVGLTNFSTSAQRVVVNASSSVLKYMTNDKSAVNVSIINFKPLSATNIAGGLYWGSKVYPIWNESGNNCTTCIQGLRPLMILLTDGDANQVVSEGSNYGCPTSLGAFGQARCIANYIKNNNTVKVNGFNVSICTIGFSTDISGDGQQLLRDIASIRPDNNKPCYFFATTSEELVEAYRTIFNAFQIAATNISVVESLNVSFLSPFKVLGVTATSNKLNSSVSQPEIIERDTKTEIRLNITSIQKDEVIDLVIRLKVKDDAPYGEYEINDNSNSFIQYVALNNRGEPLDNIIIPIEDCGFVQSKVNVVSGEDARIILR
ncbi:MAG: hypothetical protein QFX40_00210 [Archaeoglobales archaeon]|nr:hypothetical protein [Archaeoglobales archaeon]